MTNDNERRRYFRVSDLVGLRYRFLAPGEKKLQADAQVTSLQNVLSQLEEQITSSLHALKLKQPDVQHLLELYNQKINLAFGHGIAEQKLDAGHSVRALEVNLSACGIAFPCAEKPSLNQQVELDITLYPSNLRLLLMAAVIGIDAIDPDSGESYYLVRANFVEISDADQELLVQHVIKRQAIQLAERREKKAQTSDD